MNNKNKALGHLTLYLVFRWIVCHVSFLVMFSFSG